MCLYPNSKMHSVECFLVKDTPENEEVETLHHKSAALLHHKPSHPVHPMHHALPPHRVEKSRTLCFFVHVIHSKRGLAKIHKGLVERETSKDLVRIGELDSSMQQNRDREIVRVPQELKKYIRSCQYITFD